MPTPAVTPKSSFVPRTAQPPYSHVENSTGAEPDQLGLTALRGMVDVEPSGSSDLSGDPSDDKPPSLTSAPPSEDENPEDSENRSGNKKRKERRTKRHERRRSKVAKAIALSKIVVNLPEFTGKDLSKFAENFGRFMRLTGQSHTSGRVKCSLLLQCCKTKCLEKQVKQIPRDVWDECRATAERKARTLIYEDSSVLLLELALEKESDQHLNAYRPGGGRSKSHGQEYQGPGPGQGTTPKNAHIVSNVQELFMCEARDEQGCLLHAPECDQRNCFVVQGKKQETNTSGKAKLPDHYRCTITCAFCGKRNHYEDECYQKQRLSAKLKNENGSAKGRGKGDADQDRGKNKSKCRGKGQEKGKGVRGGSDRKPDKEENADKSRGNANPTPGGNSEPSGGQSNPGPTTR